MSTLALAINGLVVGNLIKPGSGLDIESDPASAELADKAHESGGTIEFIQSIIRCRCSPRSPRRVLQALFVALLVGFAIQGMGRVGEPILARSPAEAGVQGATMILWVAPIGAFGAIAVSSARPAGRPSDGC